VVGLLERGGELRTMKVGSLKGIQNRVAEHVAPGSNVMTDEYPGYNGLNKRFHHHTVNHSIGQYVKHYFCHVNGIEGGMEPLQASGLWHPSLGVG